jgi:hypothetical protein
MYMLGAIVYATPYPKVSKVSLQRNDALVKMIIFFACNPDMVLTTPEMCAKFGITPRYIHNSGVWSLRRRRYLTAEPPEGARSTGPGNGVLWRAGPALLEQL